MRISLGDLDRVRDQAPASRGAEEEEGVVPARAQQIGGWLSLALVVHFVVNAPIQAAQFTRDLLSRLAAAGHSGIVFLTNITT
ncbi:hypothetical protein QFW96_27630 [Saccharopolyspora sp. TS4A08]|uniref:Uncharacterized protein n=1 Tax=Saccharopolyspora ipomoeae TaxID=3042027 RepID=A0ABT6PX17_9PSEU|nr:hypothetical protein [Saccharopolyspora sp. TS4A08]MDI2032422.1 hypothetical protein [Saccharopolyspora sp. TS4A08]